MQDAGVKPSVNITGHRNTADLDRKDKNMIKKTLTQAEKDTEAEKINPRMKTIAYLKSIGKEV